GSYPIEDRLIKLSEVFCGSTGSTQRIPYQETVQTKPWWNYTLIEENQKNGLWENGETLELTLKFENSLQEGEYEIYFITFNGVEAKKVFS
ncbi:MAG: hypothetical protein ACTSV7_13895, partial [Candidatus Baldrarchaeia archaeon]